jgi:hypothetical protein
MVSVDRIRSIQSLAEPTIEVSEDTPGLRGPSGSAPKSVEAHRRAELEEFCAVGLCALDGCSEAPAFSKSAPRLDALESVYQVQRRQLADGEVL